MSDFIPYGKQYITEDDIKAVVEILKSPLITQGPVIRRFEDKLCEICGCKFAVAVSSGTAALHTAYFALGLTAGDEFITTGNTFAATSNAGLYLRAVPVFSEIEPDTGNIDPDSIPQPSAKTKLIVPVHYAGHPADLEKISNIARNNNCLVVEDASHAIGAEYKNSRIGSCKYSDITTFSFHPVKHITTGEGGAVLTNNREYYERAIVFRTHGITKEHLINTSPGPWYYEMQHLGCNYRITDLQAGLGLSQLDRLKENINRRRRLYDRYVEKLNNNPCFELPPEKDYAKSAWHLFPIRLKTQYIDRKKFIFENLFSENIGVQTHYIPVFSQPYYRQNGYDKVSLPITEHFYRSEISIPMFHALTDREQDRVILTLEKIMKQL